MKKSIIAVVLILALASMACSFSVNLPRVEPTGSTETLNINESLPQNTQDSINVFLGMGAGELNLEAGADSLVEGTVRYNVDKWKPKITRDDRNLRIEQETIENLTISDDLVNRWDLKLSTEVPMDLEIHAGAYEGNLDLSGLRLTNLEIADGASRSEVTFNTLNPEVIERFRYTTGASQVTLNGLANANFDQLIFESGAGDYTLDFSGDLQQDASVRVQSGVSQVTIIIPDGVRARVEAGGGLNNIDVSGSWDSSGDTYETQGTGPLLSIEVDMGVGNLRLIQE